MRRSFLLCIFCLAASCASPGLAAPSAPEAVAQPGRARPTYRVGIRQDTPPFSYLDTTGDKLAYQGYIIDEWNRLGELLHADIRFVPVETTEVIPKLSSGELDVMALAIRDLTEAYDGVFIDEGLTMRHRVYALKSKARDIDLGRRENLRAVTYSDIRDFSYRYDSLRAYLKTWDQDNLIYMRNPAEIGALLQRGLVDVIISPSEKISDALMRRYNITNVVKVGPVLGEVPLGFLVSEHAPGLAAVLPAAYDRFLASGQRAQLLDKWFGPPSLGKRLRSYLGYIVATGAALVAVFALIMFWNRLLRRRVARVTKDLRHSEQRYRSLIESSPDMIFLVNTQGAILHANERAQDNLDYPSGKGPATLHALMPPEGVKGLPDFLDRLFNQGNATLQSLLLDREQGRMEVDIAGCVIPGPADSELLACLFARDVTQRNRLEKELIQSERLATIGEMAAGIAHEVNNPLGIIQAHTEELLYRYGEETEELHSFLEAIRRNAVRAGAITKGLLRVASPKPLRREPVRVEEVAAETIAAFSPRAEGKEVSLHVRGDVPPILGDPQALQQVLTNLLLNALAAVEARGSQAAIEVFVCGGTLPGVQDADTVGIHVRDTGTGIPRHSLQAVFDPFVGSRRGGFGLGLFLTRRMVQRLGGIIFAESEPGQGTSLHVEFPAQTQTKDAVC